MNDHLKSRVTLSPDGSFFVTAPAKVNLFLHVLGRRDDGYHLLESLFAFTRRGDILHFRPSVLHKSGDSLELALTGPNADVLGACAPEDNLVYRAAHALAEYAGIPCKASIELEKHLPTSAGLGGGSADAAAALIGLSHLWGLNVPYADMHNIALSIGADVPACLASTPQLVGGIGERLQPVTLGWSAGIVIVNPRKSLATADVFGGLKTFREQRRMPPFDVAITDLSAVCSKIDMLDVMTSNSLQDPAVQLCPEIMEAERFLRLNSQYELLRMSGSGASVFALYHDKQAADAVARRVREHKPDWWVTSDQIGD